MSPSRLKSRSVLPAGPTVINAGRRTVLKAMSLVGGGFAIGFTSVGISGAELVGAAGRHPDAGTFPFGAWVRIGADDRVSIIVSQAEIGQGISTTLPAIVADELGADWSKVRLLTAPYDVAYRNPRAKWMFTGNSESIQAFRDLMRTAGAAAREMLISTAAARWGVASDACAAAGGAVLHAESGRTLRFGMLAAEAAKQQVPTAPRLKPDRELKLIGRALSRVDVPEKVDGSAIFGIDFKRIDMLVAAVRTAPAVGGAIKRFDDAAIRTRPGVRAVVPIQNGVAVVAETYWQARSALAAMPIEFDPGPNANLDSATLAAAYRERLENGPFVTPVNAGEADARIKAATNVISFDYENPFLAHATMEPMNCTAHVTADRCEIWAPTQGQELAFFALKQTLGLADDQIIVNRTPYAGGGFGRRLLPDFVVQAALIAKAVGRPVKTIWDREEDMRRDFFRPATSVRLTAALGADGLPEAMAARVVSPTILLPVFPPIAGMLKEKRFDPSAMEGLLEWQYPIAHHRVDFHLMEIPIPTSVLRTTGFGPNLFALECFVDELAQATRSDPYRYRRRLLASKPRALRVLARAAELGGWGTLLPPGGGRGIAYAEAFGSLLAQVVEIRMRAEEVKVERVVSVCDCGSVLDPGIARAGIEGGVLFGLAGCKSEITFKGGAVVEDNFQRYAMPYLAESPRLVTELIAGGERLGGIGEVSPVAIPPALANAIFAASGKRIRTMPLGRHGLRFV
ncbi:MAG: molybdopterin cofactor-binding domain-containing protein [Burkholderiales bacterium]